MRAPTWDFSEWLGEFLTSGRSHLWLTRVLRNPVAELCGVVPAGRMYLWRLVFCFKDAAAAKSLQSCPTLCDPIDRSPPDKGHLFLKQSIANTYLMGKY